MTHWALLLAYYSLLEVLALESHAEGGPGQQLGGFVVISTTNGSRDTSSPAAPHTEDKCRGYYDVMGQWDPPFVCKTADYLYCCGTCGFRFCCAFESSRLDQNTCKNYNTPMWMMTGQTPYKKNDPRHDPTKDKTNLIVYIICGVVAIMALVGIFTKLGLEKAHRPHRENMSRALASVMQHQGSCPGEPVDQEEGLRMHIPHYENIHIRGTSSSLQSPQMNNAGPASPLLPTVAQPHPYPPMGPLSHPYEQPPASKELSKYASLKAVAEKANDDFYSKRRSLAVKGGLPLHTAHSGATPCAHQGSCAKQNGHKSKSSKCPGGHPLAYGGRKAYGSKKGCTVEQLNELHVPARGQHYPTTQPYFITNSKTEVTV